MVRPASAGVGRQPQTLLLRPTVGLRHDRVSHRMQREGRIVFFLDDNLREQQCGARVARLGSAPVRGTNGRACAMRQGESLSS